MKMLLGICVLLLFSNTLFSQKTISSEDKVRFSSIYNIGLLSGQNGESFSIQSNNGVRYKSWFAGVGLGIDYYGERSVPIFLDINKTFLDMKQSPFLYMQGGRNLPWLSKGQKENNDNVESKAGGYFDVGGGMKVKLDGSQRLLFSLGFSQKISKGSQLVQTWPQGSTLPFTYTEKYVNTFNRIILKIGYQF